MVRRSVNRRARQISWYRPGLRQQSRSQDYQQLHHCAWNDGRILATILLLRVYRTFNTELIAQYKSN
jgi:hypothetical protein